MQSDGLKCEFGRVVEGALALNSVVRNGHRRIVEDPFQ